MKNLDFIIVGAQKCATTTLHHYLRQHPGICMPADKESPFFSDEQPSIDAYANFLGENFAQQTEAQKKLWGKASPQYMSSASIADNIKAVNPDTKIVAILRNPVKRAFSHYRMAVRRGTESRSFEAALQDALKTERLTRGRDGLAPMHENGYESESDFYLPWGEYGRILQNYVEVFGRDQVLVLFTEDLEKKPEESLDSLLGFLGLSEGWRPEFLGKKFHKGGGKPWIKPRYLTTIAKAPLVSALYSSISETQKKKLRFWVDQINIRKTEDSAQLSREVKSQLTCLYRKDLLRLETLGLRPPWHEQLVD